MFKKLLIGLAAIATVAAGALITYLGNDFIVRHLIFFIWTGASVLLLAIIILIVAAIGLQSMGRDYKRHEEDYWS